MDFLTFGSFVFFTALVGVITWWLTRNDQLTTSEGYFLAGRGLTGGYIAGSLLMTNLSTEQLVGLNGAASKDGLSVIAWELIAAFSIVIMGLCFLPKYLRSGITTVPEFLEKRFDRHTRTITSIIFIVAYSFILLPMILYTGATGLNGMLSIRELIGIEDPHHALQFTVWLVGIIGSIYAIFGGLRSVAVSDTLNGLGLLVGGILITWLALRAVSPEDPLAAIRILRDAHPEKFNSIGGLQQSVPFPTLFTGVILMNMFYWSTNQQIIQRTFAATSLKEGQKGVLIASSFKILAPLILVLPGIIGFHLYSDLNLKPDDIYGHLVKEILPAPLKGFFAAVVVGSVLSSFNSVLNSTATLFSLGIYREILRPSATDEQVIRSGKNFGWIVAVASMLAAPMLAGQESIFNYLQTMNGLYFIPMFAVMVTGLLTRYVPALAANLALILGSLIIAAAYFVPSVAAQISVIHEFHFLGAVFAGLVIMMVVIGKVKPRATPWVHEVTTPIDMTPWKLAWPWGISLLAIVIGIYIWFADLSILQSATP
ncbi:MAG: solute:sodium symporter family transporter [Planctomyces sp.]